MSIQYQWTHILKQVSSSLQESFKFTLLHCFKSKSKCWKLKWLDLTVCSAYHSKHDIFYVTASECLSCWAYLSQCQEQYEMNTAVTWRLKMTQYKWSVYLLSTH